MSRFSQWISAAFTAARFEQFMMVTVQGLGRLDVRLVAEDGDYVRDIDTRKETIEESALLTERMTLSYLWVLGAYEVVRTICQRVRERDGLISQKSAEQLNQLKQQLNRLRVPLAKMEPSTRHRDTDARIAFPSLDLNDGIAWQVSRDVWVTRRELADSFLATLEQVENRDPRRVTGGGTGA